MTSTQHHTEVLCALHWYFVSKNLALKNALAFRCPLSVEQQRELRQYYSEYFVSLVSATELLLEQEYKHCTQFKTALESAFVFDSQPDGESNYVYIRELRNSIIHRGLDVAAAAHVNNDFPMLVAPSPVSNRKGNKKYQPIGFYLLEIIAKCEAVIGPLIANHLGEVGLLEPQFTQDQSIENARAFMAECSSMPEWVKASAHDAIASVDHIEVQMVAIKNLVNVLRANSLLGVDAQPCGAGDLAHKAAPGP